MQIKSVAVLGAGAVGSYVIWGLSSRKDIRLAVIAEGPRAERLKQQGITINGTTYRPQVWTPQEANGVDLLVVALKCGALPGALDSIAAAVGPNTTVMSLMNGVDSEEIIAAKIGAEHVLPSLIKVASHKEADGYHFNPETTIGIIYGELAAPLKSERVQAVEALLAGTGIHSRVTPYIKEEIWSKFRLNVCNNLPQAILGAGVGCYQSSAHMKAISDGLCHELEAIAVAKGIDLSKVDASSRHGSLVPPATRYSTLQDLDAGRHTEIDMFSGALMRMGQELGIPTPYNEYTYHMIKALEEKNDGLFDYAAKASNLTWPNKRARGKSIKAFYRMRQGQCDLLLTCCTVILRFEDGRIKAQYPMDAAGAEKVKHFFTAKPDAQEEKELTATKITIIRE